LLEKRRPGPLEGPGPQRVGAILRYDLPASLVVFLVALPLSLGIAIASGAPALAGLIAAVVGGIVAGVFGGSPLQVSGPAAGLTVVVAGLVAEFGWKVTCAITVAAGVLQVVFGLSRVARAALAISPVVVHAMLAGIGLTIALQQIHVLLGGESHSSAWRNLVELPAQLIGAHGPDVLLGVLVIGVLISWKWVPGALGKVQGPLVAVVSATLISVLFAFDVDRVRLDGSLLDAIALPSLPDGKWGAFAVGVLTVALIASVESLLSAVSVDRMQTTAPRTNFDRELIGQGSANIASGALGGLPVTGVIVRSSTNVAAGARTQASAILHGIWVLVFALPFAGLVERIPMAALAGLLVMIGVQLVKRAHIATAHKTGDIAVYVVTVLGVIFLNLLEGVLIGLALLVAMTVWRVVRTRIHAERRDDTTWRVVIEGSCTFLSLPRLTKVLGSVPSGTAATVELSVDFIDHAVRETIDDWQRQHRATGGTVELRQMGTVDMDSALDGPPVRELAGIDVRPGLMPWSTWQREQIARSPDDPDVKAPEPTVVDGLAVYQRRTAPQLRPHMQKLAHAQRPETLFITCTDSRIVPNVITSSGPGDLFTVRNVGNLIAEDGRDTSIEAAIAFAVEKLHVSSVVVCGHSGCGAMNVLLTGGAAKSQGDRHLHTWLAHGASTLEAYDGGRHPVAEEAARIGFSAVDQLGMVNVAVQTERLIGHPLVADLHRRGELDVIGVFYDIGSAMPLRVRSSAIDGFDVAVSAH
jgi:carbonic anhydrase